jgi:hypothetical protein
VCIDITPTGTTISPWIYGVAVKTWEEPMIDGDHLRDLGATMLRWGGNQASRHNWEINATNSGSDWHFANASLSSPEAAPGTAGDEFVRIARGAGVEPLLTIPTIGYVARDGNGDTQSSGVPNDGSAPVAPGSEAIPGYDPSDNQATTSIRSHAAKGAPFADPPDLQDEAVYQDEWIHHLTRTFGTAEQGGVRFYALDNEPDLWSNTHRDVHPARMGYDAMLGMFQEYATAVKAVDPKAMIVAPDIWGITSVFYSQLDQGDDNFSTHADRLAHGDQPFLAWFLEQVRRWDEQTGQRSLDVLTMHHYPQSDIYPEGDTLEQNALRLRSTQQLWNPAYTDESWISNTEAAQLNLIPRLHQLVERAYPGTLIGITEWNYGNDENINGGLTIVDVLGIFGREGLDLATYWNFPAPGTPGASAFKLYRNYDGNGGHFGDQLLTTQSSDELTFAAYGSRSNESGDILVMTVNKLPDESVEVHFTVDGLDGQTVEVYQFSADHTDIQQLADVQVENGALTYTVAPYAATLFVIKQ